MTFSEIKKIKTFCDSLTSQPSWREVIEESTLNDLYDFTIDNVRFIRNDAILDVMVDEIFSDEYVLGCFNASFISENSNLNRRLVKACQDAEAFEAIGKALNATLSYDEKMKFCEAYAAADEYGHHFNHYDFSSEEITINGKLYHVFDNRG